MGATIAVVIVFCIKLAVGVILAATLLLSLVGIVRFVVKKKDMDSNSSSCWNNLFLCLPFVIVMITLISFFVTKRARYHKEIGPFLTAIDTNDKAVMNQYLSEGYNVDSLINGYYPLTFAVMNNKKEMTKILLVNGADPNNKDNGYPIMYSVQNDNIEVTKILLANGADPDLPKMPLFIRAYYFDASFEMFKTLFEAGVDFNRPGSYRETPLYKMVNGSRDGPSMREKQIISLFLMNNADIYFENSYGESTWELVHSVGSTPDYIVFFENEVNKYYGK